MISILKIINNSLLKKYIHYVLVVVWLVAVGIPCSVWAQNNTSLTLSVSPTLFEMTANPDDVWASTVRVINSNPYDITVYTDVVNFEAKGEAGQGKFIPVLETETEGQTLAEWINLEKKEITIPAEQTIEVPFTITAPENAPPGGHFAAIMVGTRAPSDDAAATVVETSQVVTSLVFLRVTGDITEEGVIREFRSTQYLYERPEVDFELRFQNKGNVHILPQGEIRILNMWGEERGVVPVNRQTMFGNVLPDSIRRYSFTWTGEWSLADIGRYTAVATLAYGEDSRQFANHETTFWIVPWKEVGVVLVVIVGFILLITWAIRLYIRKMLNMAGVTPGIQYAQTISHRHTVSRVSVVAPLEDGILDLRQRLRESDTSKERLRSLWLFVCEYRIFFTVLLSVTVFIGLFIWYVQVALVAERPYEVVIDRVDHDITISSEEVAYDERKDETAGSASTTIKADFPAIRIVNKSGVTGLAADLRLSLEAKGYPVVELTSELDSNETNTVIVYAPEYADQALELSGQIFGALLSAYPEASDSSVPLTIYVGKDLESAVQ